MTTGFSPVEVDKPLLQIHVPQILASHQLHKALRGVAVTIGGGTVAVLVHVTDGLHDLLLIFRHMLNVFIDLRCVTTLLPGADVNRGDAVDIGLTDTAGGIADHKVRIL